MKIPRILCNPTIVFEHAWIALEKCGSSAMIECGVYDGFLSSFLAFGLAKARIPFCQYAADTFTGFPEKYEDQKVYSVGDLEPDAIVISQLKRLGITVLVGDIADTLQDVREEKFFFCFFDMDSYVPTKFAFDFLKSKVIPGGRIGFHDYGAPSLPGIKKLVDKVAASGEWKPALRPGKKDQDNRFFFLERR